MLHLLHLMRLLPHRDNALAKILSLRLLNIVTECEYVYEYRLLH